LKGDNDAGFFLLWRKYTLLLIVLAIVGCGSGGFTDTPATPSSSPATSAAGGAIALSSYKLTDGGTTYTTATLSVSIGSPAKLTVIVKNSDNTLVAGRVVSFSSTFDLPSIPLREQLLPMRMATLRLS
jgi:hypothetical protein